MSLDGYVASKDDDLSFLSTVEVEGEDYGYTAFTQQIDTYIVGYKTYEVIKKLLAGQFPQAQQYPQCYVISRQERNPVDRVIFYRGDVLTLIQELKSQVSPKNIYCDGGPQIAKLLLEHQLIDEFIISIIPVLLGDGKKLFQEGIPYQQLQLRDTRTYPSGLVKLHYSKRE